jgi:hypothetical protein
MAVPEGPPHVRRKGAVAVVLLVATVLFAGLYRFADGAEKHSYNAGAVPPSTVAVTEGHTYEISVPGGRKALTNRGVLVSGQPCTWTQGTGPAQVLKITVLSTDVRPTHALATFTAPVSGRIHIDCGQWGAVFVDDADDSGWDFAGLFLVLTAICLTLGVALGLSALYGRTRHDDEIERAVEVGRGHDEVGGRDGGDVLG